MNKDKKRKNGSSLCSTKIKKPKVKRKTIQAKLNKIQNPFNTILNPKR